MDEPFFDPDKMLLLHASAVQVNNDAVIFLGPSGTGKSTVSSLLDAFAPKIADERVYALLQPEGYWIVGDAGVDLPEPKIDPSASKSGPRLRAVFRLYQSATLHVQRIAAIETCYHLTASLFELPSNTKRFKARQWQAFSLAASVARTIPGYHCYFDLAPHAPQALYKAIIQQLTI